MFAFWEKLIFHIFSVFCIFLQAVSTEFFSGLRLLHSRCDQDSPGLCSISLAFCAFEFWNCRQNFCPHSTPQKRAAFMDYPIVVWCSLVASLKRKEEREVATIGLMWELSGDTYCHHKENKIYFLPHGKSPSYVHSGAREV